MANNILKAAAKDSKITQWQIAEAMGISESKLNRILRHELSPEEAERIMEIINQLSKRDS